MEVRCLILSQVQLRGGKKSLRKSHLLGNRACKYRSFLKEFSLCRKKQNRTLIAAWPYGV